MVEIFAPKAAAARRVARSQSAISSMMGWPAAPNATLVYDKQGTQDANAATLARLDELRRQCRYAALNNPVAKSVRRTLSDHVIGTGITPRSSINPTRLGITQQQASEFQNAADEVFLEAAKHCDLTRRQGWVGLQRLIYLAIFDGGDVFASFPMVDRGIDVPVDTCINLIEAERVETPPGKVGDASVRGGVQIDARGVPVGYWVTRQHPGDALATRRWTHDFWPASRDGRVNVLHGYGQERIGQARGLPALWAAQPLLDQVGQYVDSTLLAAEIQTRLSMWIVTNGDPEQMAAIMAARSGGNARASYDDILEMGVDSGSINILNEGDNIKSVSPSHPGQYFDGFLVRLLRLIGASAGGVPYELFANDVAAANYSSIRAALMSFRKTVAQAHEVLLPIFATYRQHVLREAWLRGRLLPNARWLRFLDDQAGWTAAQWHLPAMGWIDPTTEVQAYSTAVESGFMTRGDVIAQTTGQSFEEVARRRQREADFEQALSQEGQESAA
jgi:lambda family phage portal protein